MDFLSNFLPVIVSVSALWVYIDASKDKIGNTPQPSLLNVGGAGWWGVLCLLLWAIVFPIYLMKRNKLNEFAKESPLEPKNRNLKIGIFSAIVLLTVWWNFFHSPQKLPECSDSQAVDILKSAILNTPAYKLLGFKEIQITDISERPSTTKDKRICRASMNLGADYGSQVIYYSIDWQDKDKGEFWVQTIQGE